MVNPCEGQTRPALRSDFGPDYSLPGNVEALALMAEHCCQQLAGPDTDPSSLIVNLANPDTINRALEKAGSPGGAHIPDNSEPMDSSETMMSVVRTVGEFGVKTSHPAFLNQLYGRADPISMAADWFTVASNTQVFTYEVAPVFTMVEKEVISKLARLSGGEFRENHEGLFVPGGSIANLYAMHMARYERRPNVRNEGMYGGKPLVAFVSEHVHYSYKKAAMLIGLGLNNMCTVPSDSNGAMIPEELEKCIQATIAEGKEPYFVGAVSGSTVMGAYDPLRPLAAIAKKYGLWIHADGCWGGGVLLSEKQKFRMDGIEECDSWSLSLHKMMGIVTQCAAFISKRRGLLKDCNGLAASYLFQKEKENADLDLGDLTFQCGRRADGWKAWLAWKVIGDAGFERRIDRTFEVAALMKQQIEEGFEGRFLMALPQVGPATCFWYLPKFLRGKPESEWTEEDKEKLAPVAVAIKKRLQQTGGAMIGFQPLMGKPNFFRAVFPSAAHIADADIINIMQQIADAGDHCGFNE